MQTYELLYIVPAQFADTEIDSVRDKIARMTEQTGAKVTRNESLGKIKLAYPIKHQRHGTYVIVHFEAEPNVVAGLDRQLRLSDEVLRHLIVERDPALDRKEYHIASYVAPLSDEARAEREARRGAPVAAPVKPAAVAVLQPSAPAKAEEMSMSMEELDKKLDEILDQDVAA
jgi:small subunit ribosomal protein S6